MVSENKEKENSMSSLSHSLIRTSTGRGHQQRAFAPPIVDRKEYLG